MPPLSLSQNGYGGKRRLDPPSSLLAGRFFVLYCITALPHKPLPAAINPPTHRRMLIWARAGGARRIRVPCRTRARPEPAAGQAHPLAACGPNFLTWRQPDRGRSGGRVNTPAPGRAREGQDDEEPTSSTSSEEVSPLAQCTEHRRHKMPQRVSDGIAPGAFAHLQPETSAATVCRVDDGICQRC